MTESGIQISQFF